MRPKDRADHDVSPSKKPAGPQKKNAARRSAPDAGAKAPRLSPAAGAEVRGSERINGAVARQLGTAIVSGAYKPGDVLNDEITFSEQLNVSRTAYREAIKFLAAKGLVASRPKTGTRVSERGRWNFLDLDVLSWFFEAPQPDPELVRGIFELREIVEPAAAALAAKRRDIADVERMRRALMDMERYGLSKEEGRAADREFHDAIIEATHNDPLQTLSSGIGAAVRWTTVFKQRRRKLPRDPMPDHWRVFDAIATGNPELAHVAMKELIRLALEDTQFELEG
jgi:DNA-binding FadR family transcriptional regulator